MSDPVKLMYRDIRCIEILDVSHSKELKVMKKIFHHKLTYLKKKNFKYFIVNSFNLRPK